MLFAIELGIDSIHFGSNRNTTQLSATIRSALPWLMTLLVFLMIVAYIPAVSLWLPEALGEVKRIKNVPSRLARFWAENT